MRPADFASTSFMYASAPLGTITLLSTTMGASNEALNTWPAEFVFESMASIVRIVTIVFAGTVTVTGGGGGGGAGVVTGAAAEPAIASAAGDAEEAAATSRDFSVFRAALAFAVWLVGLASAVGGTGCGTMICAAGRLI